MKSTAVKNDWYSQLELMPIEEFKKKAISTHNTFLGYLSNSNNLIQKVQQTWALRDLQSLCELTKKRIGVSNEFYLTIYSNLGVALRIAEEYNKAKKFCAQVCGSHHLLKILNLMKMRE